MPSYVALGTFTDQGLRSVKDTTRRAEAAREVGAGFGVRMKDIYWTQGAFDMVVFCEAEDEASMTAFSLATAANGNVRFQTLRAFSHEEMTGVLRKLA